MIQERHRHSCIGYRNDSGFGRYDKASADVRVTLKVKAITGIASLEKNVKKAEFTCTYAAYKTVWAVVEKPPETCTGAAAFQLYDDGWRVIAVKTELPHHRGR